MVDRLCCYLFLQQQEQSEEEQPLQISFLEHPLPGNGIFASVQRLRRSMGDTADRVLLLLFLMKCEGHSVSSDDATSSNSTPIRSHESRLGPSALLATAPHSMASVFLQSLTRHDSLVPIHPLGRMQVSCFAWHVVSVLNVYHAAISLALRPTCGCAILPTLSPDAVTLRCQNCSVP